MNKQVASVWETEQPLSVEFLLQEISPNKEEPALKTLLPLQQELRSSSDSPLTADELLTRFPQHSALVCSVLNRPLSVDSLAVQSTMVPAGDLSGAGALDVRDSIPSSSAMRIPRELGRYRIIRKLGQGAMGSVFLAQDTQLQRQVGLKTPRSDCQQNREFHRRFEREAQAAAALHHPNICPIFDIGQFESIHFISMGYIQGFSLSKTSRLPIRSTGRIRWSSSTSTPFSTSCKPTVMIPDRLLT